MADRASKLRKLNAFQHKRPYMSASALADTLKGVKEEGLPDLHGRNHIREARDATCAQVTRYGPLIQHIECVDTEHRPKRIPIAFPAAMLWVALTSSVALATLFDQRLEASPSSPEVPWHLVLYSDEVTPGNPMQSNNKRKFHGVYYTFLELGAHALSREESWLPLMTEYSNVVNTVQATLSQVFGQLIKSFFNRDGFDFEIGGIVLPSGKHLWATLGIFLQDGAAHRQTWCARAGACRLCLLCKKIFTEQSEIVDEDGTHLLRCNAVCEAECEPATDDSLRSVARYLQRKRPLLGNTAFTDRQKALGITHIDKSILLDRSLDTIVKPVTQYMHDWMHTLFVDGVVNVMVYLLFEAFISDDRRDIYALFSRYIQKWTWPGRYYTSHLHEIFADSKRDSHRTSMHIKCQASDLLTLMPVLALFVVKVLVPTGVCKRECRAFVALCDVVELITSVNRGRVTPDHINKAVSTFLRLFVAVFGAAWLTPKFHWLIHFSTQLKRWGTLLACFVNERYHRNPKQYASQLKNTSSNPGLCLLKEVVCHQLGMLEAPSALDFTIGLVHPRKPKKAELALITSTLEIDFAIDDLVRVASDARFNVYSTCKQHDCVLVRDGADSFYAAQVMLHFDVDTLCRTFITKWTLKSIDRAVAYSEWNVTTDVILIDTAMILDAVVYARFTDPLVVAVLLPLEFR